MFACTVDVKYGLCYGYLDSLLNKNGRDKTLGRYLYLFILKRDRYILLLFFMLYVQSILYVDDLYLYFLVSP